MANNLDDTDVFLLAALHMIHKSVHYTMVVHYNPQDLLGLLESYLDSTPNPKKQATRPCSQTYALVEATTAGDLEPMGDNGYKLTTHGVKDLIQPKSDPTYT